MAALACAASAVALEPGHGPEPEPETRRHATYVDGPLPGHTGGFGEPSCHRCHFDRPVGPPGGDLSVAGVPESYHPGVTHRIEVRVTGEELGRGGFQLSARCGRGEREGKQAGTLVADSGRVEVVEGTGEEYRGAPNVQYAQHTLAGAEPTAGDTASWVVRWTAPAERSGPAPVAGAPCDVVRIHLAANVANGDDSEFGDRIYLDTFRVSRVTP